MICLVEKAILKGADAYLTKSSDLHIDVVTKC